MDRLRAEKSIGTLGGGNHFIEVDKDDAGNLYLVVHSGSRHLGVEVASYYQEAGYKILNRTDDASIEALIAQMKAEGRLRKYVVISLNTNSATTVGEYERIAPRRVMGMCWSSSMRMATASGFPWPIRRPPTMCASIPPIRFWSTGTVLSRHTPIGSDRTASTRRPDKAKTCMPPV